MLCEDEIVDTMAAQGSLHYEDPAFSTSGDSLYRTPQQPPAGALMPPLVIWGRISRSEIRGCHSPVTFPAGENSSQRRPPSHPDSSGARPKEAII